MIFLRSEGAKAKAFGKILLIMGSKYAKKAQLKTQRLAQTALHRFAILLYASIASSSLPWSLLIGTAGNVKCSVSLVDSIV